VVEVKLREVLEKVKNEAVVVNGIVGKIVEVGEEVLVLEVVKNDKKLTKETIYFPLSNIQSISTGEKEMEKGETEKEIDEVLESI
jgi:hypothetical protein